MLSALRLLYQISRLHQKLGTSPRAPHLVCNSQGLIQSIQKLIEYPTIYPNITMGADWDCLAQILDTIQDLDTVSPSFEHVKGHQDATTPYEELSLAAQLNCDADTWANYFLRDHPDINHTTAHLFPNGEWILQLLHGTVTRNIKQVCAESRTLPPFICYMTKTSSWFTHNTFDLIDWTAHEQALKKHGKHRTTLVKYIHHILPLGKQVHRYDIKYPPNCPSCNTNLEDMPHFWKCPATTRLDWRRNFLKALRQKLIDLKTGIPVRELLISILRAVLDGEDPSRIPENPSVSTICTAQSEIRWDQLMRGRFAKAWATHPQTQPETSRNTKSHWTTNVIEFIFEWWWQLWDLRNQDRHGRDIATTQQAQAQQVDRELTILYHTFEDTVPQHLSWIFDTPIAVRRQWTTTATRQWLNTWKPILHEAVNPEAAPTNPENYPYTTALETG